ncbi:glycosyltransferase family 4 protein [Olivibacter sitiensis]|uniref:glycosyltransferase family 4 protein n=1 Tax=Olivibacter sitiensis TaxID=376470 RepID=UPI0004051636|nr:glycosyltransferase family 1 protein [Olivibacter sitiensis]
MRIGVLGTYFEERQTGIGNYVLYLFELMIENLDNAEFVVYSNSEIVLPKRLTQRDNITLVFDPCGRHLKVNIWLKIRLWYLIGKDRLDFFFSGTGILPLLPKKVKSINVLHDLNYLIVPNTMGKFQYISHALFLKRDILRSNYVIVNSRGTNDKMLKYFGKKANAVIKPRVDEVYKILPNDKVESFKKGKKLDYQYFLTVGTLEPRKNFQLTLDVFIDLYEKGMLGNTKLILIGTSGWKNNRILERIMEYEDLFVRLDYVSNEELVYYYNGALALLFPSLYEGYGIPVREALCCGTQVIASDLPELREAGGEYPVYIEIKNAHAYANAILCKSSAKSGHDILKT